MAMYPYSFSSDPSLGPKVKTNKKRGVGQMACCGKSKSTAKKSSAKKSTSTKKSSCKKKPC